MTRSKLTQAQVVSEMAERMEVEPKMVKKFFTAMTDMIEQELFTKGCPEEIAFPIGLKVKLVRKPATKERTGRNPFTGEEILIKAKPARDVIKTVAMKKLKSVVEEV